MQWEDLVAGGFGPGVTWQRGRDGSLTARLGDAWLGGSALPALVGERMTRDIGLRQGSVALIAPNHLGHVVALASRLEAAQSLTVIWPDVRRMRLALGCADVSSMILQGKLVCFAGTHDIASRARRCRGWAVPGSLHLCGDAVAVQGRDITTLVTAVQGAIQSATDWHAGETARVASMPASTGGPMLVAAGSSFRLLADAGRRLTAALAGPGVRLLDLDDARSASRLAFADAAAEADSIVTADVTRADVPNVVPSATPWVTWISRPRSPVRAMNATDGIVLADDAWRNAWLAAGWSSDRVKTCSWPVENVQSRGKSTLLAFDLPTQDEPPAVVKQYSSQAVAWGSIAEELQSFPYRLRESGGARSYLLGRLRATGLDPASLDLGLWHTHLVTPSFARGVGRLARRAGATLAGLGWPGGRSAATAAEVEQLVERHAAVLDPTPDGLPAIASLGLPVIRAAELDPQSLARHVREARGRRKPTQDLGAVVRSLLARDVARVAA